MRSSGLCTQFSGFHFCQNLLRTFRYLTIFVLFIILNYLGPVASLRFCYFRRTATLRTNVARFQVTDINFTLCTHYVYGYAKIDNISWVIAAQDPATEDGPTGLYRQFVTAKIRFPSIKTILSMGGSDTEATNRFESLHNNDSLLQQVASSVVQFLRVRGFDGLEVDWITYTPSTMTAHARLLTILREKFDGEEADSKLILTATGPGIEQIIDLGYDVNTMAQKLDYVIMGTNALFYDTQRFAHFATPLYTVSTHPAFSSLSLNRSVFAWKQRGMPFSKMIVGFTGVGRLLELVNQSDFHPGAPVTTKTLRGPLYNITSGLAYSEICLMKNTSSRYFDDYRKSPYLVQGTTWVGYDDRQSLKIKVEWASQWGVAGTMFSGLDEDDFTGTMCGKGRYPLLSLTQNQSHVDEVTPTSGVNIATPTPGVVTRATTKLPEKEKKPAMMNNIIKFILYVLIFLTGALIGYILSSACRRRRERSLQNRNTLPATQQFSDTLNESQF